METNLSSSIMQVRSPVILNRLRLKVMTRKALATADVLNYTKHSEAAETSSRDATGKITAVNERDITEDACSIHTKVTIPSVVLDITEKLDVAHSVGAPDSTCSTNGINLVQIDHPQCTANRTDSNGDDPRILFSAKNKANANKECISKDGLFELGAGARRTGRKRRIINWDGVKYKTIVEGESKATERPPVSTKECDTCHAKFSRQSSMVRHRATYCKAISTPSDVILSKTCDVCGVIFKQHKSLQRHNLTKHGSTEEKTSSKECDICHKKFSCCSSMARHRARHGKAQRTILPRTCDICGRAFKQRKSVRRHILAKHRSVIEKNTNELNTVVSDGVSLSAGAPESDGSCVGDHVTNIKLHLYNCLNCQKRFTTKHSRDRHIRIVHKLQPSRTPRAATLLCPLCALRFTSITEVTSHLFDVHQVTIKTSSHTFDDIAQFQAWKETMEIDTKSFYNLRVSRSSSVAKTLRFSCNRSGNFVSKTKGKKSLKVKGSRKMGRLCPASLKVVVPKELTEGNKISVMFNETHVGHVPDVCHLSLPRLIKQELVAQLAQGIPAREIKERFGYRYITTKDLSNIRAYSLNSTARRKYDSGAAANFRPAFNSTSQQRYDSDDAANFRPAFNSASQQGYDAVDAAHCVDVLIETQEQDNYDDYGLSAKKLELKEKLQYMMNIVEECGSNAELDLIAQNIAAIAPALGPSFTVPS